MLNQTEDRRYTLRGAMYLSDSSVTANAYPALAIASMFIPIFSKSSCRPDRKANGGRIII